MEETAQKEGELREKIVSHLQAAGHPVSSVTPETENPLEIAEEMLDVGGKSEGNSPSSSFLGRIKARLMRINKVQTREIKEAA